MIPVILTVEVIRHLLRSRSAIAAKPRCSVYKVWRKYSLRAKSVHVTSLCPMAQKTFRNAEPFRRAQQLLPMLKIIT